MTTGPLPMGMICCDTLCNPGCAEVLCDCVDPVTGLNRCFPVFQVKFENIAHNLGGGCTACNIFDGTWFQETCLTDQPGSTSTINGVTAYWYTALNFSIIDPCTGTPIDRKVHLAIDQTGTLITTVKAMLEASQGGNTQYAMFTWDFTVVLGECPDYTNTSNQTPTTGPVLHVGGDVPCTFSTATALFRWV